MLLKCCEACLYEIQEGESVCDGCGFALVEIDWAVNVVDAVGPKFGVDTGTVQDDKFREAVMEVLIQYCSIRNWLKKQ